MNQLLLALQGDEEACTALAKRYHGQACGVMLLALSYRENMSLDGLFDMACGLGTLTIRLPKAVAVLCNSPDAILLTTLFHRTLERFQQEHPEIRCCCGSAPLDWGNGRSSFRKADQLLSLALALDLPLLTEPLTLEQRQFDTRLETMRRRLQEELVEHRLTLERCASLKLTLAEFPHSSRYSVAIALLEACIADNEARQASLKLISDAGPENVSETFSIALQMLGDLGSAAPAPTTELIQRARDVMQARFSEAISLSSLAEELHITPAYLSSLFHREMRLSYSEFLLKLRMEDAARRLLEDPQIKVYEVGEAVGFPSAKHFAHVFREYYHLTPKEYRDRNAIGRRLD